MALNSRFATAMRALMLLAAQPDKLHRSEDVAGKLKMNPVVVRRVFSQLQQADLVVSQKGPSGGSRLARTAAEITLRDIHQAIHPQGPAYAPTLPPALQASLKGVFSAASRAFERELAGTTLAQLVKQTARRNRR
ncbi:MAG: RrF2 family transcriptional regulator [Acidobacteriaceae bacterium]